MKTPRARIIRTIISGVRRMLCERRDPTDRQWRLMVRHRQVTSYVHHEIEQALLIKQMREQNVRTQS